MASFNYPNIFSIETTSWTNETPEFLHNYIMLLASVHTDGIVSN